jgi:hypothetical protein
MSDDSFADAPISIAEHKANVTKGGAALWTVRDMLIAALRDIDSGKIGATWAGLVIAYDHDNGSGTEMHYYQRCHDSLQLVGLHTRAAVTAAER